MKTNTRPKPERSLSHSRIRNTAYGEEMQAQFVRYETDSFFPFLILRSLNKKRTIKLINIKMTTRKNCNENVK